MNTFKFTVLAADHPFFEGDCVSITFPATDGMYGIQANHSNMVSACDSGKMTYTQPDGKTFEAAISSGIIKVENGDVLMLVDTAERPDEIDENRAKEAALDAVETLKQKKSIAEYKDAQAKLARALARLKVKGKKINID